MGLGTQLVGGIKDIISLEFAPTPRNLTREELSCDRGKIDS